MIRAVFGIIALGGVLCFIGYQEYKVSEGTSEEPVPVTLVKLETGVDPPNNHIQIGDHAAVYDELVYCYEAASYSAEPSDDTRVSYCYYPIVSMSNPYMKSVVELHSRDPESITQEEYDSIKLEEFKVIVKSNKFDHVKDLPYGVSRGESIKGMVINQISSLGREEKRLLQESFPDLELDSLIILHENDKPTPESVSYSMMGGGGLLMLIGCGMVVFAIRS